MPSILSVTIKQRYLTSNNGGRMDMFIIGIWKLRERWDVNRIMG
jgi:hypothetical protein